MACTIALLLMTGLYGTPVEMVNELGACKTLRRTHIEIAEEGIHQKIQYDERRKDCVQNTHKNEPPS